jgi:uncharacterized protein YjbI with pentapeptide repeats
MYQDGLHGVSSVLFMELARKAVADAQKLMDEAPMSQQEKESMRAERQHRGGDADEWRALLVSGDFDSVALKLPSRSVVDLRGADLRGLNLENMGIFPWDLSGADLRGATFDESFIIRCRLEGAVFDAPSQQVVAILDLWSGKVACDWRSDTTFRDSILDGLDLSGRDLGRLTFKMCSLRGATFANASFEDLDLSQSDLSGADLTRMKCNSEGGDANINLQHVQLGGTRLGGSSFSAVRLDMATGQGSSWVGVKAKTVVARYAKLSDADFSESIWGEGAFANCKLPGLNTERADFGEVCGLPGYRGNLGEVSGKSSETVTLK